MKIYCTRPRCPSPNNFFPDLDDASLLDTVPQKYCTTCGMPLILAGRYLPEKLLGQGGFGAAFLARDRYTPTKRYCVVKQFQPPDSFGPEELKIARQLFNREAEVLEQLGKKNSQIPDLYAFFPLIFGSDQFFYLVQEFIDGQTLEQELETKGAFSEQQVIDLLKEMLPILQFIHNHNSIHRDIKPSNIIRSKDGVLYLLDFGAVKQVTTQGVILENKSSTGIYSQGFAPPEQMAGDTVYPSTDLYALAATCINLLTGQATKDLYDFYDNSWKNWRQYTQISDRLANILDAMLKKYPKDRPQSAQEVLDFLNYPTTQLPPPSQPQPPAKPTQLQKSQPSPPAKPPKMRSSRPPFSLIELLSGAGFVGFQSTLIFIVAASFLSIQASLIILGVSLLFLILVVFLRIIEKWDFVAITLISLGLVWWIAPLHEFISIHEVDKLVIIVFPLLVAAGLIAITTIFRLIYRLLSILF